MTSWQDPTASTSQLGLACIDPHSLHQHKSPRFHPSMSAPIPPANGGASSPSSSSFPAAMPGGASSSSSILAPPPTTTEKRKRAGGARGTGTRARGRGRGSASAPATSRAASAAANAVTPSPAQFQPPSQASVMLLAGGNTPQQSPFRSYLTTSPPPPEEVSKAHWHHTINSLLGLSAEFNALKANMQEDKVALETRLEAEITARMEKKVEESSLAVHHKNFQLEKKQKAQETEIRALKQDLAAQKEASHKRETELMLRVGRLEGAMAMVRMMDGGGRMIPGQSIALDPAPSSSSSRFVSSQAGQSNPGLEQTLTPAWSQEDVMQEDHLHMEEQVGRRRWQEMEDAPEKDAGAVPDKDTLSIEVEQTPDGFIAAQQEVQDMVMSFDDLRDLNLHARSAVAPVGAGRTNGFVNGTDEGERQRQVADKRKESTRVAPVGFTNAIAGPSTAPLRLPAPSTTLAAFQPGASSQRSTTLTYSPSRRHPSSARSPTPPPRMPFPTRPQPLAGPSTPTVAQVASSSVPGAERLNKTGTAFVVEAAAQPTRPRRQSEKAREASQAKEAEEEARRAEQARLAEAHEAKQAHLAEKARLAEAEKARQAQAELEREEAAKKAAEADKAAELEAEAARKAEEAKRVEETEARRLEEMARRAQGQAQADEEARVAKEAEERPAREREAAERAAEAEAARIADEARPAAEAEAARIAEEARLAAEAEAARKAEEVRLAAEAEAKRQADAEAARQAELAKKAKADEEKRAEQARKKAERAAKKAEKARLAEIKKKQEEIDAEQARLAEAAQLAEMARRTEELRKRREELEARKKEEEEAQKREAEEKRAAEAEHMRLVALAKGEAQKKKAEEDRLKKEKAAEARAAKAARLAAEAEKKRLKEEAEEAERKRLAEEAAEAEKKRLAEEAAEAERVRLAEEAAEAERVRLAEEAAEAERVRLVEAAAEAERGRLAEEAAAETEGVRLAEEAAEAERVRLAEEAAEAERVRLAEEAAEAERVRLAEEAAEAERVRIAEEEAAKAREAQLAKEREEAAEAERGRLEKEKMEAEKEAALLAQLAKEKEEAEAEAARQAQRVKEREEAAEAERGRQEKEAEEARQAQLAKEKEEEEERARQAQLEKEAEEARQAEAAAAAAAEAEKARALELAKGEQARQAAEEQERGAKEAEAARQVEDEEVRRVEEAVQSLDPGTADETSFGTSSNAGIEPEADLTENAQSPAPPSVATPALQNEPEESATGEPDFVAAIASLPGYEADSGTSAPAKKRRDKTEKASRRRSGRFADVAGKPQEPVEQDAATASASAMPPPRTSPEPLVEPPNSTTCHSSSELSTPPSPAAAPLPSTPSTQVSNSPARAKRPRRSTRASDPVYKVDQLLYLDPKEPTPAQKAQAEKEAKRKADVDTPVASARRRRNPAAATTPAPATPVAAAPLVLPLFKKRGRPFRADYLARQEAAMKAAEAGESTPVGPATSPTTKATPKPAAKPAPRSSTPRVPVSQDQGNTPQTGRKRLRSAADEVEDEQPPKRGRQAKGNSKSVEAPVESVPEGESEVELDLELEEESDVLPLQRKPRLAVPPKTYGSARKGAVAPVAVAEKETTPLSEPESGAGSERRSYSPLPVKEIVLLGASNPDERRTITRWPKKAEYTAVGTLQEITCDMCTGRCHWCCAGFSNDEDMYNKDWICPDCKHFTADRNANGRKPRLVAPAQQERCIRWNCILHTPAAKKALQKGKGKSDVFVVEGVIGRRILLSDESENGIGTEVQYLVKWEGYAVKDGTWEIRTNLEPHARQLIAAFKKKANEEGKDLSSTTSLVLLEEANEHWSPMTGDPLDEEDDD